MRLKIIAILFVAMSSLTLIGCNDEEIASNVLSQFCDSFPDTTIYETDKRILWVQTRVDGISSSVADTMFKEACAQANSGIKKKTFVLKNIKEILNFPIPPKKEVVIAGFNGFWVVWPVRNGVDYQGVPLNYQVMNYQAFHDWLTQYLGYMPTPDQIRVITLQNVQNTPKGQPMQVQTLAEIQQQKKQ